MRSAVRHNEFPCAANPSHIVFSTLTVEVKKRAQLRQARQGVTLTRRPPQWRRVSSLKGGCCAAVLSTQNRQQLLPFDRPTASRLRPSLDPSHRSIVCLGANGEIDGKAKAGRADPVQVRTGSPQRNPGNPKGSFRPKAAPAGSNCICVCTTGRRGADSHGRPSSRVKRSEPQKLLKSSAQQIPPS